jgi:hypothetical protein
MRRIASNVQGRRRNRYLQRLVQAEAEIANGSVEFAEDSNARS